MFLVFVTDEEFAAEVPSGLEEDEDEPFFQVKEQNWHQHHHYVRAGNHATS